MKSTTKPGAIGRRLDEMLRVDHAGEYAAVAIYRGQRAVFDALPHKAPVARLIRDMEDGEAHHLETFDDALRTRRIRPTLFAPLWNAAGFALGAGTALCGEKAAMACTSAVEDAIEKHYAEQIGALPDSEADLRSTLMQFREDEIGHHDTAIAHGAEEAPLYKVMKAVIGAGCRAAIKVAEKL